MIKTLNRDTNTITVANFWENHLLGKYNYDPAYQRKSVWTEEKQSFLIDSILKNFPMPPIFVHQQIDDDTGKTKYDIIDGKQRLFSIIRFLNNEIPVSDESENSPFYDSKIAGVYFQDLDKKELSEYKKRFWRYLIPIEFIDTESTEIIDNIFDRLNRNGEALKGQELRKSKYHNTPLLSLIEDIAENPFWKKRLAHTDLKRMEDFEFLSELIFYLLKGEPLQADQKIIDKLYEDYAKADLQWDQIKMSFEKTTKFMEDLDIDYDTFSVHGVSHLYGLWCFADHCLKNNIIAADVKKKLRSFYMQLRSKKITDEYVKDYKQTMSSRTKERGQRKRRVDAICKYIDI